MSAPLGGDGWGASASLLSWHFLCWGAERFGWSLVCSCGLSCCMAPLRWYVCGLTCRVLGSLWYVAAELRHCVSSCCRCVCSLIRTATCHLRYVVVKQSRRVSPSSPPTCGLLLRESPRFRYGIVMLNPPMSRCWPHVNCLLCEVFRRLWHVVSQQCRRVSRLWRRTCGLERRAPARL